MARAGHAEGEDSPAAEVAAAEAAPPLRAVAGVRGALRGTARRTDRRVADRRTDRRPAGARRCLVSAHGLQARDTADAPDDELQDRRRAWPPAVDGAQPRAVTRRARRAGSGEPAQRRQWPTRRWRRICTPTYATGTSANCRNSCSWSAVAATDASCHWSDIRRWWTAAITAKSTSSTMLKRHARSIVPVCGACSVSSCGNS